MTRPRLVRRDDADLRIQEVDELALGIDGVDEHLPVASARETVATVSLRVPVRSVQRTTCDQNLLNPLQRTQRTPHLGLASEVKAAERPSP